MKILRIKVVKEVKYMLKEGEKHHLLKENNVRMEKNNLLYIIKIEEKVGEIPADKIDKVVSAKDEKNVNDKIRRKIISNSKNVYGKID